MPLFLKCLVTCLAATHPVVMTIAALDWQERLSMNAAQPMIEEGASVVTILCQCEESFIATEGRGEDTEGAVTRELEHQ